MATSTSTTKATGAARSSSARARDGVPERSRERVCCGSCGRGLPMTTQKKERKKKEKESRSSRGRECFFLSFFFFRFGVFLSRREEEKSFDV